MEYPKMPSVGSAAEATDLLGEIGAVINHGQKNAFHLKLWVDLPLNPVYGPQQKLKPLAGR